MQTLAAGIWTHNHTLGTVQALVVVTGAGARKDHGRRELTEQPTAAKTHKRLKISFKQLSPSFQRKKPKKVHYTNWQWSQWGKPNHSTHQWSVVSKVGGGSPFFDIQTYTLKQTFCYDISPPKKFSMFFIAFKLIMSVCDDHHDVNWSITAGNNKLTMIWRNVLHDLNGVCLLTCILLDRRRYIRWWHRCTDLRSDTCSLHSRQSPLHSAHPRSQVCTHTCNTTHFSYILLSWRWSPVDQDVLDVWWHTCILEESKYTLSRADMDSDPEHRSPLSLHTVRLETHTQKKKHVDTSANHF